MDGQDASSGRIGMTYMRGPLRSKATPADLARGLERDRARFKSSVVVDPSTWEIAKLLQLVLRGEPGEGLRGVFKPREGEHGRLYWWPAHLMAHGQGMRLLGIEDRVAGEVLEVEANVAGNGTIHLAWSGRPGGDAPDHSARFLAHPSISDLVDGCLARRGRQIVLTHDGIRLTGRPVDDTSIDAARQVARREGWRAVSARVDVWTRCRRKMDPRGLPVPAADSLRPLRHFIAEHVDGWHAPPVPMMTAMPDGAVHLRWSGGGSATSLIFRDRQVHVRLNDSGTVTHLEPITARTARQVALGMPILHLERFPSHVERDRVEENPHPGRPATEHRSEHGQRETRDE